MRIGKASNGIEENMILRYLEENASNELVIKINKSKHELRDCWNYIREQAKRMASNGCAVIEDHIVYGWAVHYYEEDGKVTPDATREENPIREVKPIKKVEPIRKVEPKEEPKKRSKEIEGQMDIFQFIGGTT